jgi:hypothetical protein
MTPVTPHELKRSVTIKPYAGDQLPPSSGIIEVRLREMSQLFDTMDPSPFREKDLDRLAEEYIVESAKELPRRDACSLIVLLDEPPGVADERAVGDAIRAHFARRSGALRRSLRQLLRRGLISLGIGVVFLAVFFLMAQLIGRLLGQNSFATLFREGLLIVGWVAMWRPLEIFLYDWWPIVGERRISDRLSAVPVQIVPSDAGGPNTPAPSQNSNADSAPARSEAEDRGVLTPDRRSDPKLQTEDAEAPGRVRP